MKLTQTYRVEEKDIEYIRKVLDNRELINQKLTIRIIYLSDVIFYALKSFRNVVRDNNITLK